MADYTLEEGGSNYPNDEEASGMRAGLRAGPKPIQWVSTPDELLYLNFPTDPTIDRVGKVTELGSNFNFDGTYEVDGEQNGEPTYVYSFFGLTDTTITFDGSNWIWRNELVPTEYLISGGSDAIEDETWTVPGDSTLTNYTQEGISIADLSNHGEQGQIAVNQYLNTIHIFRQPYTGFGTWQQVSTAPEGEFRPITEETTTLTLDDSDAKNLTVMLTHAAAHASMAVVLPAELGDSDGTVTVYFTKAIASVTFAGAGGDTAYPSTFYPIAVAEDDAVTYRRIADGQSYQWIRVSR